MTPKWYERLKEADNTRRNEQTSARVGSLASGMLRDQKSTPAQKSVAGSALTQRPDKKWWAEYLRQRSLEQSKDTKKP
jgi:hypothetical protein